MSTPVYATEGDIEKYLAIDIDASLATWLEAQINAAELWIDTYCQRTFKSAVSADRYFDAKGGNELDIETAQGITAVVTLDVNGDDDVTLTTDDYFTYPYQSGINGLYQPTTKLILKGDNRIGHWPTGRKRVKITATWGYPSTDVPGAVKQACMIIVGRFLEKAIKGGKLSAESIGDVSLTFEKIDESQDILGVYNLLNPYRAIEV